MKTKLHHLREVIIKEIPEIVELKFGCKIKAKKLDNVGRYIVKERKEYRGGITFIYYDVVNSLAKEKPFWIGCNDLEDNFEIIGRDITLADVLRVIKKVKGHILHIFCRSDGVFGMLEQDDEYHNFRKEVCTTWDLTKPLSGQSEPTLNLLKKLILNK